MSQYDCNFCGMGKYNRALAYRIIKELSRREMQMILRWDLINKVLHKNKFKKKGHEKVKKGLNKLKKAYGRNY